MLNDWTSRSERPWDQWKTNLKKGKRSHRRDKTHKKNNILLLLKVASCIFCWKSTCLFLKSNVSSMRPNGIYDCLSLFSAKYFFCFPIFSAVGSVTCLSIAEVLWPDSEVHQPSRLQLQHLASQHHQGPRGVVFESGTFCWEKNPTTTTSETEIRWNLREKKYLSTLLLSYQLIQNIFFTPQYIWLWTFLCGRCIHSSKLIYPFPCHLCTNDILKLLHGVLWDSCRLSLIAFTAVHRKQCSLRQWLLLVDLQGLVPISAEPTAGSGNLEHTHTYKDIAL